MTTKNFPPSIVKVESSGVDRVVANFEGNSRTVWRYVGLDADGVRWAWYQDHERATDHQGVTMLFEGTPYGWQQVSENAEAPREAPLNPEVFPPEHVLGTVTFEVDPGWDVRKVTDKPIDPLQTFHITHRGWQTLEEMGVDLNGAQGHFEMVDEPNADTPPDDWIKLTPAQQVAMIAIQETNNQFEHQTAIDELYHAGYLKYDTLWGQYDYTTKGRELIDAYRRWQGK